MWGGHGSGTVCPTGESRRRGHQGSQRPLRGAPANLRPSRPVTGEGTRPGKQGRGCGVGEPRREFRGGPCLTHRSPFVLAAAPQSRGEGGGVVGVGGESRPVPPRPSAPPPRRAGQFRQRSLASKRGEGEAKPSSQPTPPSRGVTCEEKEPARHLPPGYRNSPARRAPSRSGAAEEGRWRLRPPGNILGAYWLPRRPTPPSPRPTGAVACAHWRRRRRWRAAGRAEEAERGDHLRWQRGRCQSLFVVCPVPRPLRLTQRREPGGLPLGLARRLAPAFQPERALPPRRGGRCPAHLAGRGGRASRAGSPCPRASAAATVSATVTRGWAGAGGWRASFRAPTSPPLPPPPPAFPSEARFLRWRA